MITIDKEFQSLIPPLSSDELLQLTANIKADGCLVPLVVWGDVLLDGHNRYKICRDNKIAFETVTVSLADRDAAKVWIIKNQLGRRNLPAFARIELATKLEPLLAAKAKENQVARKGNQAGATPQKSADLKPVETRDELAAIAGVSHDTIAKAKLIQEHADEETKAKLRAGDKSVSINSVAEEIKESVRGGGNTTSEFSQQAKDAGEEAERDSENLWKLKSLWKKTTKRDRAAFLAWTKTT